MKYSLSHLKPIHSSGICWWEMSRRVPVRKNKIRVSFRVFRAITLNFHFSLAFFIVSHDFYSFPKEKPTHIDNGYCQQTPCKIFEEYHNEGV